MNNKFGIYFKLQLKRVGKLVPSVLAVTLLLLVCVCLVVTLVLDINSSGEATQKTRVGIVGDMGDTYLRLGVYALQNLDSSGLTIEFETIDASDAERMLKSGKINAYVEVPDGFVEAVGRGEDMAIRYVTTDGAMGIGAILVDEIVGSVSDMIVESENAVYGMQHFVAENDIDISIWNASEEIIYRYLFKVLDRNELFEIEIIGVSEELSMLGYYVCGMAVLFLMLWGISASPLFVRRDTSLLRLLSSRGQGCFSQVMAEYLAYFILMLASIGAVCALAAVGLRLTGYSIPELEGIDGASALDVLKGIVLSAAVLSAMQFLLYELVSGAINSVLVQFLSAVAMGYVSGCFYPINFFPESVRKLGALLPTGVARSMLGKCFLGRDISEDVMLMVVYLAVLLVLTAQVRRKKIV